MFLNRDDHAEKILPVGDNEIPIDDIFPKERVDMLVVCLFGWTIELEVFPVAYPWHQFNAQQIREAKHREILPLSLTLLKIFGRRQKSSQ